MNVGALVLACNDPSPSLSSERGESDRADDATKDDANSVEDTNDPRYQCYMGKAVRKGFWFQGRVISLDVGRMANGNEGVLIQVEFDDGDKEDYDESEWQSQLVLDNDSTSICEQYHPLGAIVWKKFVLEGEVTGCRIGEPVVIVVMLYDDDKNYMLLTLFAQLTTLQFSNAHSMVEMRISAMKKLINWFLGANVARHVVNVRIATGRIAESAKIAWTKPNLVVQT